MIFTIYISIPKNKEEGSVFEVSEGINPPKGNPSSLNVIIEFSDFQCPACKAAIPVIDELLDRYDIAFYYRNFPLEMHENSFIAAEAAECANEQGKFWEYHDVLFENQGKLNKEGLKSYAEQISINTEQFNNCLDNERYKNQIESDIKEGKSLGIVGTPTFFVNGRKVSGADKEKIQKFLK